MRLTLQLLSVVMSLVSAWLWWRASRQPPPTSFEVRHTGELDQGFQGWVRSSARANSWAARCTALAVVLQAMTKVCR
ncbi:MAG: hypothetical protein DMD25_14205 [Gemmatimonadetes bacterium]|nr:MAG: hypothetical protein DMD27_06410 [Gemmatimonadota bacterium]PYP74972.1 MAG: hypothetical protein DMD25_14205 [Gemmatimonadota bacterium]